MKNIVRRGEMQLTQEEAERYRQLCSSPDASVGRGEVIFDREHKFTNGLRMAIQVIGSAEPEDEPCWTQGVLYDIDGSELGCTDVGESLLGDFTVEHNGTEYTVTVSE